MTNIEKITNSIIAGEYKTKEDLAFALKLLINSNGTQIDDLKTSVIGDVDYLSFIEKDGDKYIKLDDVKEIINKY